MAVRRAISVGHRIMFSHGANRQPPTPHPLREPRGFMALAEPLSEGIWHVDYLTNFCKWSSPRLCQMVKLNSSVRFKITGPTPPWVVFIPDQILRMPYNYKAQNMKPLNSWPGEKSQMLPSLCQKSACPLLKHNHNVNFSMNWQRIILEEKLAHRPCTELHSIPNSYSTTILSNWQTRFQNYFCQN